MNIMKLILCSIFTICFGQVLVAQTYEWTKTFGSGLSDQATALVTDNNGYTYTAGSFKDTMDFDSGPGTAIVNSQCVTDAFIVKTDAQGNVIWAKGFGGASATVRIYALEIDPIGNIIAVGTFNSGTIDFDPNAGVVAVGSGFGAGTDAFVLKLENDGDFLWVNPIVGTGTTEIKSVLADVVGNLYVSGHYSAQTDFDPTLGGTNYMTSSGGLNVFIQKYEPAGILTWTKFLSGSTFLGAGTLDEVSGQYIISGQFTGSPDFDPTAGTTTLTSIGSSDGFIAKYTSAGDLTWAKSFGGTTMVCSSKGIVTDASGNIYSAGLFHNETYITSGQVDFDPSVAEFNVSATGNEDLYIQKLDANGLFVWTKVITGPASQIAYDIAIDAANNIDVTGLFSGTTDMDPKAGVDNKTAVYYDLFVEKLSPAGDKLWVTTNGGPSAYLSGINIAVDPSNSVYTAGFFYETGDFNPGAGVDNIAAVGSHDVFLQKLSECVPNSGTDIQLECGSSFTWINGITYSANNNSATYTIQNQGGCDSVVTLDLTFVASYAIEDVVDVCGPYTWINGITYTSSTTADYDLTTQNGCDSNYHLILTITPLNNSVNVENNTIASNATGVDYQWFDCMSGNELVGENAQLFVPTTNGQYACIIDNGTCSDTTTCVTISTIGLEELSIGEMTIYPNPGSAVVTISTNFQVEQINVYNSLGAVVMKTELSTFSVENWSNGVYMFEAVSDKGMVRARFIKK